MGRGGGGRGEVGVGCSRCELCGAPAAVHCEADAAFLCAACDAKVHGANFLASRHIRTRIHPPAGSSEEEEEGDGYASAASSCVSTADSATTATAQRRRVRRAGRTTPVARAEVVLEVWAKRMGFGPGAARRRAAAAWRALRAYGAAGGRVPPRVAMAGALWSEVAAGGSGGGNGGRDEAALLRRLEACAHVPARMVVAVATSMARVRARRRDAVEEGWDECAWAGPKSSPTGS